VEIIEAPDRQGGGVGLEINRGKQKAEKSAVLYFSNMRLALEHERKRHVNNMMDACKTFALKVAE